jgi:sarcosine oxidase subunit alpha
MLNELGFIIDDGVTARLADDHFLMHTTSGGADRIAAWLEEWLQTEWPDLKVLITPVTEQWAQFAVAGPGPAPCSRHWLRPARERHRYHRR